MVRHDGNVPWLETVIVGKIHIGKASRKIMNVKMIISIRIKWPRISTLVGLLNIRSWRRLEEQVE